MTTIAVTGASGFVGRHLVERLSPNHQVRCAIRSTDRAQPGWRDRFDVVGIGQVGSTTDWTRALAGAEAVIHLAAIAHRATVNASELLEVNVEGVRRLAEQAARHGVKRLLFVSTIGVHGRVSAAQPIDEASPFDPHDPYARSKLDSERIVQEVSSGAGLEWVIVRPPMVYGSNAPGNFARLVNWIRRGVPLPFGALENRRSLVSVGNLSDFLACAIDDERAANQAFVVSDGEDVSTPDLIRQLATMMGRRPRLINVPRVFLRAGLFSVGRSADFVRLCGSLQVNAQYARHVLGWRAPFTLAQGLEDAASAYASSPAPRRQSS